jgi:hypothetical protein
MTAGGAVQLEEDRSKGEGIGSNWGGPNDRSTMTLAERLIAGLRLPYALGCLLVGFGLFGFFDTFLTGYVGTSSVSQAIQKAISPQNLAEYALFAYAFYAPRYMRMKLRETANALPQPIPGKMENFRMAVAGLSAVRPQVVTWLVFLAGLLAAVEAPALVGGPSSILISTNSEVSALEFFASVFDIVSLAMVTLALSSVVWTYYGIARGIHRFSAGSLQFRPYYEDPFLGLKPVGSLVLSLVSVYFGLILLFILSLVTSTNVPTIPEIIGVGGFLAGLIIVGVLLFFIPLQKLHGRMVGEKQVARATLTPELRSVLEGSPNPDSGGDARHVLRLELMDRKMSEMAVWPYDIGILGRLSVIAVSVTAILISRIVALIFHI